MSGRKNRSMRDPYYFVKLVNMVLAFAVLILVLLILFGEKRGALVPVAYVLGALMCALSGVMELSKNKPVTGYLCSVFSGILAVALLFRLIRMWL